jgi:hypothetical protein
VKLLGLNGLMNDLGSSDCGGLISCIEFEI